MQVYACFGDVGDGVGGGVGGDGVGGVGGGPPQLLLSVQLVQAQAAVASDVHLL